MARLKILVLHDGKPGHLSQSLGLAELISEYQPGGCDIGCVQVRPLLKVLNRGLRSLVSVNAKFAWRAVVGSHYRGALPATKPDLVISFGGDSLAMNIALSRYWRVPNIHIGNCYGVDPALIRANPVLEASGERSNQLATRLPISRRMASALPVEESGRSRPRWLMLVGGNGSGYEYDAQDWRHLADAMAACAKRHQIDWLVSTSRRSGPEAEEILQSALQGQAWCAKAIFASQCGGDGLAQMLSGAERIFCSEDSLSMVSESVAMAKPVVSLGGTMRSRRHSHQRALETFAELGWYIACRGSSLPAMNRCAFNLTRPMTACAGRYFLPCRVGGYWSRVVALRPEQRPGNCLAPEGRYVAR